MVAPRADAEDAMQRHRSALKACLAEGVSYRYAREVQDRRMRGERLARGSAWSFGQRRKQIAVCRLELVESSTGIPAQRGHGR